MSDFTPRHAIVTGSDSGIGAATALAFAAAGIDVAITYNSDEDGAQKVAAAVRE
ncbi:SDR family NAD(P)-dependent oxidoreductase, partial [Escherichia coli]|uniref:SDR family NAD(P)-dependent oxidoreductase n=2 Tax=Bacteria TaxID=2 RepID=UPI0039E0F959